MEIQNCQKCTRTTNNKYFNCPPHMSDGRHFTDYRPTCKLNSTTMNSYDYRQYLINHAEEIIKKNMLESLKKNLCGPCDGNTMLDHKNILTCDKYGCHSQIKNKNGLGTKIKYSNDNEKDYFNDNNNYSCCVTQMDDINQYPINGMVENDYGRYAVPHGGIPLTGTSRNPFT